MTISEDVSNKLDPKLEKIEKNLNERMQKLDEKLDRLIANQTHFIKAVDTFWIGNPKNKMCGTLDGGAIFTVSGMQWIWPTSRGIGWNWPI